MALKVLQKKPRKIIINYEWNTGGVLVKFGRVPRMDALDRMRLQGEIGNWKMCLASQELTEGEREVTQKLIDDAEEALRTGVIPEYKPPWAAA